MPRYALRLIKSSSIIPAYLSCRVPERYNTVPLPLYSNSFCYAAVTPRVPHPRAITYISMSSARVYKSITTTVVIHWDSGQTRSTEVVIRPLTTVWSAAPGCPTTLDSLATGLCVPPQWDEVWFRGAYYSPGICPSGYTAGCYAFDPEFAGVKQTRHVPELTPKADETAVICVPL